MIVFTLISLSPKCNMFIGFLPKMLLYKTTRHISYIYDKDTTYILLRGHDHRFHTDMLDYFISIG